MHKTDIETVRLFDSSRNNVIDCVKMQEAVDLIYDLENEDDVTINENRIINTSILMLFVYMESAI